MRVIAAGVLAGFLLAAAALPAAANEADDSACWGQASAVFGSAGEMGEHASQQAEPRAGLRNLARQFYEAGIIADDSLQTFGAYLVDSIPELTVEACE